MSEIDVFGITHPGRVRSTNNDHFLIASFHRTLKIHHTSVQHGSLGDLETASRGFLMLVGDGVGGLASAGEGSALVLRTLADHLLHATELSSTLVLSHEQEAVDTLRDAIMRAHGALIAAGRADGGRPATTLTMFAGFWPRVFIVHVGDSRFYRLRDGKLECLTSDQTYEQLMLQSGAIKPGTPEATRLKNVLWSAVGNEEIVPQVVTTNVFRRDVSMLCSDGLTKHVSDEEIRQHLAVDEDSEVTCRKLLALVLDRGASDNVTICLLRVHKRPGQAADSTFA
jgi:protein phosphatase